MLWWGISSRWVSTRLFGYQRKEGLPSAASENTLEFSSIWRTSSFVSTWDLNSVLNRCSLGLLRAQCYHCPPFSLLIPHIYLPVCQSSEVSWFLVFRWIILCTLVTSPCVVSLKFLLKKKKKEKTTFRLPLFLVLKALSVQHLFNFAFQPRQLTFTFLLCQIVRVPKALHSFFIFRKNIHHFYISLNNWQGEFSYIVMTLEIGNLSPFTDKKNEAPRVKLPAQGHIIRTGSSRILTLDILPLCWVCHLPSMVGRRGQVPGRCLRCGQYSGDSTVVSS